MNVCTLFTWSHGPSCLPENTSCGVGQGSGPSTGRIGLDRFGSGWVQIFPYVVDRAGSNCVGLNLVNC